MPNCELCGKETQLFKTDVEGVVLEVCKPCSSFGTLLSGNTDSHRSFHKRAPPTELPESKEIVMQDFANKIRTARGQRKMIQEDFAKMLNEKLSVIQKLENGSFVPPIPVARKLEKLLGVKLVENSKEESLPVKKQASDQVTIGDIIRLK